ncbi:MAG: hypothetical protein JWQ59_1974 [Cryobacterium sp.]|jgi:low temperature requirement protein LtrA|nr:hypothetical protein [Cryobacterium sp.]
MATVGFSRDLLRPESGSEAHRVTFTELFFDLVFVFAVTQVSHVLLHDQGVLPLVHTVMLTAVVWWVWINTTWTINWLNPERGWVRGLLIALMLLGILMSSAIPESFTSKAWLFAGAMVALELGRSIFTMLAFARHRPDHALNFARISVWHAVPGALWLWGAFAPEDVRLWIWLVALCVDSTGPRLRFWVPVIGRSGVETWDVSGQHMSERVSLFFLIVLGESIVVTGTTFSAGALDWPRTLAFLAAFAGTVLMWLMFFSHAAEGGSEYISNAERTGPIARLAYTYIPLIMVLGVVLAAVADGLVLHDPAAQADVWTAGLACVSFAAYLIGNALFRRTVGEPWLISHFAGALALLGLFAVHPLVSALMVSWLANAVVLIVVISDELIWRRRTRAERARAESTRD